MRKIAVLLVAGAAFLAGSGAALADAPPPVAPHQHILVLPDGSESMGGMVVTPGYFRMLGLQPILGREFTESEMARPNTPPSGIIRASALACLAVEQGVNAPNNGQNGNGGQSANHAPDREMKACPPANENGRNHSPAIGEPCLF